MKPKNKRFMGVPAPVKSTKRRTIHLFIGSAVAVSLSCIIFALVSAGTESHIKPESVARGIASRVMTTPGSSTQGDGQYVRRSRLGPQLIPIFTALGDRLERPGKERLILTGTLSRISGAQRETNPFRLISEFPRRLRLEEQIGIQTQVTVFDGREVLKNSGRVNKTDEDLVETLMYDTAESYFIGQASGAATRFLGSRFRLDSGEAADYAGPFYEIYQVGDEIQLGSSVREQDKFFYFNSDTLLLEQVRYEHGEDRGKARIEVRITDWQRAQGQRIPARIARFENGQEVLAFSIISVVVGPRVAGDGIFDRP